MKTRHSRGISRAATEQLLDGRAVADVPGTDQLAQLLAAASAPARESELAGEQMAMAAFEANHLATSVSPQKEHTSMLAKIFTAKVLLSSLAAFATGGVALAAGTGALNSPHPNAVTATAPATPTVSAIPSLAPTATPSSTVAPQPTGTSGTSATQPAPSATASSTSTPSSIVAALPSTAAGLCNALAGDVNGTLSPASLVQALGKSSVAQTLGKESSEFSSLIATAGSAANVADYCSLLLDLPQLPDPSQLAQLPGTVLAQALTALPVSTLTTDLSSLPTSTLSQVLSAVPVSALSTMLSELPSSVVSQLLSELPVSVVTQLLTGLPASVLSQVLSELPSSLLSQLPTSLLGML